eukprot:1161593-Pelagomonas_calceolata.AAC.10
MGVAICIGSKEGIRSAAAAFDCKPHGRAAGVLCRSEPAAHVDHKAYEPLPFVPQAELSLYCLRLEQPQAAAATPQFSA